jgi:hypothetical protein
MDGGSVRIKIVGLAGLIVAVAIVVGWKSVAGARASTSNAALVASASGPKDASPPRLMPAAGYGSYDGCNQHCTGSVQASLWRPLHLPIPAQGCPTSNAHRISDQAVGSMLGPGPVYPGTSPSPRNTRLYPAESGRKNPWKRFKVLWVASASYRGPVLIRGRQLHSNLPIGFGNATTPVSSLQFPAGDENSLSTGANGVSPGDWRQWP